MRRTRNLRKHPDHNSYENDDDDQYKQSTDNHSSNASNRQDFVRLFWKKRLFGSKKGSQT